MSPLQQRLGEKLAVREQAGLLRQTRVPNRADLLDFSSNDYLGLCRDPKLAEVFAKAARQLGLGAGASHLLGGHSIEHERLCAQLCEWTGREAAVLFASGFQAALGAFGALVDAKDSIVADRLAHACLLDGAQYACATLRRFQHNDIQSAAELLARDSSADHSLALKWLVSESVFSMDGDLAPVLKLAELAHQHDAAFMLDEAHAIGVLGANGCGLAAANGLDANAVPVLMITFGKALGSAGAAILGSRQTIAAIENFSRPFIYTTAMPNALAAATGASVKMAQEADDRRAKLQHNIQYFRTRAEALGLALSTSQHAIQPILLGHPNVVAVSEALLAQGIYAPAVRAPTVPANEQRLRVSLNALHAPWQIERLVEQLAIARDQFATIEKR
jgi:8-amino-7-oxononanoate synthase